jgi:2-hydroxycyclohexanecarboxyl-CoA dehydrogenase
MQGLAGKTVIVTGGGGGIGNATCERLAQEGAQVAVLDRDLAAAQATAQRITAAGGKALAVAADITRRSEVDAAVQAVHTAFGPVDVLVNNAGWDVFKPFAQTAPDEWERLIAINLVGALHMHHSVLPDMVARRGGALSTWPPMRPASVLRAKPSTPPARAGWWLFPRPWRASMPATASP